MVRLVGGYRVPFFTRVKRAIRRMFGLEKSYMLPSREYLIRRSSNVGKRSTEKDMPVNGR